MVCNFGHPGRGPAGRFAQPLMYEGVTMTYVKPALQRFGSIRELTLGLGPSSGGDATSLYHRS